MRLPLAAVPFALVTAVAPLAAQHIDTGHNPTASGGVSIIASQPLHGQFFTVPVVGSTGHTSITSFSLGFTVYSPLGVRFGIAEWNGGNPGTSSVQSIGASGPMFGALLHTSEVRTIARGDGTADMHLYAFDTPLNLTAGSMYLAFLDIGGTGNIGSGAMEGRGDTYASGGAYTIFGSNQQILTSDFAFQATFGPEYVANVTATPEPTTWVLLATGLVAIGGISQRRARAR
jgi:hypothetical protein